MTSDPTGYAILSPVPCLQRNWTGVLLFALALNPLVSTHAYAEAKSTNLPGVQATAELPSEYLRGLRRTMTAGGALRLSQLRELADAGDGLAAAKFADLLAENDPDKFASDIVHYYTTAAYTGRDYVIGRLTRVLATAPDLPETRRANAEAMIVAAALDGDEKAAIFLSQAYAPGGVFTADPAKAEQFALAVANADNPDIAMDIALTRMESGDLLGARDLLVAVQGTSDLGQATLAAHLLTEIDTTLAVTNEGTPDATQ